MKTKRIVSFVLALTMIFALCACADKNSPVGTWTTTDHGTTLTVEFKKDGTMTFSEGPSSELDKYEWSLEDGKLYIDGDPDSGMSFKDGKLTLKDDGETFTFKRK